ncbi:SDR family oxidoreductase [soil metagenome]
MTRLLGRRIVVTGAAHGLGRAYAERFAVEGARVAVADRDAAGAEAAAARIRAAGVPGGAEPFAVDVADAEQVRSLVDDVLAAFGGVDVLVNNAGGALYPTAPFETVPPDHWDHVLAVNLKGPWLCACAVAPHMKAARGGTIINISSTTVTRGYPAGLAPYIAAKAGVVGLTRALAQELGPFGVTVNCIAPGYTRVEMAKNVHGAAAAEALQTRMVAEQCLKRPERPQDLLGAVVFLASAEAGFVTGQVLHVDGGWALR